MIAIMAVALGGLSTPTVFDTIGEPETLEPRWEEFKDEMETYLAYQASGVVEANQKKSLLLHVGGKGLKKIYLMKTPDERKATGDSDVYQVALDIFNNHYRLKKTQIVCVEENHHTRAAATGTQENVMAAVLPGITKVNVEDPKTVSVKYVARLVTLPSVAEN